MPPLTLLNTAYLAALGLGAIPIIIHLIRRRRVKVIPWAAWEFLKQSTKKNRRRLQLEQLILLLIRILIVCIVVFALCRPVLRSLGLPLMSQASGIHVLIALDNSYSMGYGKPGDTAFERGRRAAEEIVRRAVKPGDSVSFVLCSSRPNAVIKEPSYDIARAIERIRGAKKSDFATDYTKSAVLCRSILQRVRNPVREVYWITDNQRVPAASTANLWKDIAASARLTWIDVGAEKRDNVAVEPPIIQVERIAVPCPVRITATVHNYTSSPLTRQPVQLIVDGNRVGQAQVNAPPGGRGEAQFVYLFDRPGSHTGAVEVAGRDLLPADDSARFAFTARARLSVLVSGPASSADPATSAGFYLSTALSPDKQNGQIQATARTASTLAGVDLRPYDVVILSSLDGIRDSDIRAIDDFVIAGGGLLVFGDGVQGKRPPSPSAWGLVSKLTRRSIHPEQSPVSLNPMSIPKGSLEVLRSSSDVDLGRARFVATYDVTELESADKTICAFTDGRPALIERKSGAGKLILATFSAGTKDSDLPFRPAFVPFLHQLVADLAGGRDSRRQVLTGEPIEARFPVADSGKPIHISGPSGLSAVQKGSLSAGGVSLTFRDTARAGNYTLSIAAQKEPFAVNLPPEESNLARMDDAQLRAMLGAAPVQFAHAGESIESVIRRTRTGSEIWRPLVSFALGLLFLEALLAQRFGRR